MKKQLTILFMTLIIYPIIILDAMFSYKMPHKAVEQLRQGQLQNDRFFPKQPKQDIKHEAAYSKASIKIEVVDATSVKNLSYKGQDRLPLIQDRNHSSVDSGWFGQSRHGSLSQQEIDEIRNKLHALKQSNRKGVYYGIPLMNLTNGTEEQIQDLIDKGADVNLVDDTGWNALHWAVIDSDIIKIERLLKAGADINAKAKAPWRDITPLHLAAICSNINTMKVLLDKGANIDAKNEFGYTPLHFLTRTENFDETKLFIEQLHPDIARIYAQNNKGKIPCNHGHTPFHVMLRILNKDGKIDSAKFLIEKHGADIYAKDNEGRAPLDYCNREEEKQNLIGAYDLFKMIGIGLK